VHVVEMPDVGMYVDCGAAAPEVLDAACAATSAGAASAAAKKESEAKRMTNAESRGER
jgi:hypothetical protein